MENDVKALLVGYDDLETNRVLDFLTKSGIPHDYVQIGDDKTFDFVRALPVAYCRQFQLYGAEEICENIDTFYKHTKEWFESH